MKFLQYVGIAAVATTVDAFTPSIPSYLSSVTIPQQQRIQSPTFLRMSSSTLPEAKSMRVGELKKELDSYRISTKSFFEKSELVDAVEKARAKGTTPKTDKIKDDDSSSSTPSESSGSREESLEKEMENCKSMKAGDLKKELESYGINTKSFFEKSEFVKACAEARVDGVTKKADSGGEGYAEYADVEVLTDDTSGPRKRSSEQQSQGQSQSSNPFGGGMEGMGGGGAGGSNPFGGGGMGGIADMMKNMGGGGGGGANPFGGGGMGGIADMMKNMGGGGGGMPGGMPGGGDQMKKAQEMMSNPKVREIIMKAQSNPKIMKAVQECMSNPMAFAKYQNDPEVGELIRELQTFM